MIGTPQDNFNWLKNQYYAYTKPILLFVIVFMRVENVSPHFEKEIKGTTFMFLKATAIL